MHPSGSGIATGLMHIKRWLMLCCTKDSCAFVSNGYYFLNPCRWVLINPMIKKEMMGWCVI